MNRFVSCRLALVLSFSSLALFANSGFAQDTQYSPQGIQIPGPNCAGIPQWYSGKPRTCQPYELSYWLADVTHWRDERRLRIGFNPAIYDIPALKWTQSSFVQPQMMVHDRYFYDPATQKYTVDKYLADLEARYGGIDSVLIWHTYPNIGIDSRNQFDMLADLPGGIPAVKRMIADFHRHGVKVLFPVMVWDQGTHPDPDLWKHLSDELAEIGADGVNGDTLDGIPQVLATDSIQSGHPLALEPENGLGGDEKINWNTLNWGYWNYDFTPSVSRYKWLETRHQEHLSNRWAHNHRDDLQEAFFNGIGFESWENVWGIWNQLTPRDAESLRRIALIDRAFAPNLISPEWEPFAPTRNYGVFASKWPGPRQTLWTIVNRNPYEVDGGQLRLERATSAHYYDLWHGIELEPRLEGESDILDFPLEAHGFGAILITAQPLTPQTQRLLAQMKTLAEKSLDDFSDRWQSLPQTLVEIPKTTLATAQPAGMIRIPATDFTFRVNGIEIEGMDDEGVDVQYPWEDSARRYHEHRMHIDSFYIDKYPVTNSDFKKFLDATHYAPADAHNFLKDWVSGTYPEGWADKPVTWVSLEDARAYAKWAGKRLPHEWEWQYAAQGSDGRRYPWGNTENPSAPLPATTQQVAPAANGTAPAVVVQTGATPWPDRGRDAQPPTGVDVNPAGASPFGVEDLVGNIWQWTDEYQDEHTRYAILRGGSHYQPQGSRWYFPQAYELSQHGKYLLMAPSLDRSATVGFRCAVDAAN